MIEKEEFAEFISEIQKHEQLVDEASKLKLIDVESPFIEFSYRTMDRVFYAWFQDEGADWIYWWLYERVNEEREQAWNENKEPIPTKTIDDLWEIVEKYRK